MLRENEEAFAWTTSDMSGIDPNFFLHKLALDASIGSMAQR